VAPSLRRPILPQSTIGNCLNHSAPKPHARRIAEKVANNVAVESPSGRSALLTNSHRADMLSVVLLFPVAVSTRRGGALNDKGKSGNPSRIFWVRSTPWRRAGIAFIPLLIRCAQSSRGSRVNRGKAQTLRLRSGMICSHLCHRKLAQLVYPWSRYGQGAGGVTACQQGFG
jgi:hypothetical protein